MPAMFIIHHASREQVQALGRLFAEPFTYNSGEGLFWRVPKWVTAMLETATY